MLSNHNYEIPRKETMIYFIVYIKLKKEFKEYSYPLLSNERLGTIINGIAIVK